MNVAIFTLRVHYGMFSMYDIINIIHNPTFLMNDALWLLCYCVTNGVCTEQWGGVSKAHYHLKTHALKRRAENRAVFDQVK